MDTLKSATTAELLAEIKRRERGAAKLRARRDKLAAEISDLDAELAALDLAAAPGRGGTRARNAQRLPDALAAVVEQGAVVSPKEAAALVRANGYESNAASFNVLVATALSKDQRFNRVGRGQYERVG